ncbi:MAG TPA: TlpA disulfide reductase family protein [Flavobacterium sp.]|nr:TlpA disulfide reductase family protein [Flavobacterium sp.]
MKNTLILFLALALTSFGLKAETITIAGKITNVKDGKIRLMGESYSKDITLKPDGSFSETLNIDYSGSYMIVTAQNRVSVYLTKGTNLIITADNNDFYKSLKYSGKGSLENQYIASKNAYVNAINQEKLYSMNEADFLKENQEIKKDLLQLLNSMPLNNPKYNEKELKNIDYLEQVFIANYEKNHAHFTKSPEFKAAADFPKLSADFNADNELDFLFSNAYKQLVYLRFNENIEKKLGPDDNFVWKPALEEIKKVKSPAIRNALCISLNPEITGSNPDAEKLYSELMAISTNPLFKKDITEKFNKLKTLSTGKPSPAFDYENHKGGKTSLASLSGKYVYIDVWATWCGPCRQEIPSLQKVEAQYEGKNIAFVSISIDARKDYEKWKKMVTDQSLGGIQLIADNDWSSQFAVEYGIASIPRFILVGPDGNIINSDAPRPSDPKLVNLFTDLKL